MKKHSTLIALLLILALCASTAIAAPSISLGTDITGNAEQKDTFSGTLSVTNDGDQNVSVTITASDLTSSTGTIQNGDITISPASITALEPGNSQDLTIRVEVPNDQEEGQYEGTITATYNNGSESGTATATLTLDVQMGNHLIIDRVDMEVDGDDQRLDDGERHDQEAKPRSEVTIEVRVKNDFDDNIEIEDIEVEIDAGGDLDWNEDDDISDLEDGDRESITFTFDVPEDADEDTYDIDITVSGVDEDGNSHGETWTVELEVDKERYDLEFGTIDLSPSYLDCGETQARISVNMENIGSNDVDEGTLVISSSAMRDDIIARNLEIDEGDDLTRSYTIETKEGIAAGEYFIDLQLYTSSNSDDDTDVASVTLSVLECAEEEPEEDNADENGTGDDGIDVVTPTPTQAGDNVVYRATGTTDRGFLGMGGNAYLVLLAIIALLLIVLIGLAIAVLSKS